LLIGTFSNVLLGIADARYKFIYISYGSFGYESDGGIFDRSDFRRRMRDGSLFLPEPDKLPSSDKCVPFHFLGDSAFPLLENLQKPFSHDVKEQQKRIFNYRYTYKY
jgi:hypothetical protein